MARIGSMELGHILDSNQTRQQLDEILKETKRIKDLYKNGLDYYKNRFRSCLQNKTVILLFDQPSTRTIGRFTIAAQRLGADLVIFNGTSNSSMAKGESWQKTIKTLANLEADAMVVRHPEAMAPHIAAETCKKYGLKTKIINAGDGPNFHPTQAMLDIFTIREYFGKRFDNELLKIAIGADITNARAAHSLMAVLAQYSVKLFLIGKHDPWLPTKYLDPLYTNWTEFCRMKQLPESEKMDIIYWFRYQTEHGNEELRDKYNIDYKIDRGILDRHLEPNGLFIHPGPRGKEIDSDIDQDPRVKDGDQVNNGLYVSMAILKMMLNPEFYIPAPCAK